MTSRNNPDLCSTLLRLCPFALELACMVAPMLAPLSNVQRVQAQSLGASTEVSTSVRAAPAAVDEPVVAETLVSSETHPPGAEPVAAGPTGRDTLAWGLGHRAYSTWSGSSGSIFVEDPGMAEPGSVRVQLALDIFSGSDFLYHKDSVEQNRQTLSLSWTALQAFEMYASLQNRSVNADVPVANTLSELGDLSLGFKVGGRFGNLVRLGGGIRGTVPSGAGKNGSLLGATSFDLRGSTALDFQGLDSPVPLLLRLNLDYLFDNSGKLVTGIEERRYDALKKPGARADEVRNLINRVERFGLGVNRVDMFTIGFGVEIPVEAANDFYLHPMLDYRVGLPINRQGYNCAFFSSDKTRGTNSPGTKTALPDDTCLDDAGAGAFPMDLALGVRIVPPVRGLSITIGVDIGLSGTDSFVRELAPMPDIQGLIALGYDYDARPVEPVMAPPPPPPPAPSPKGRLLGHVTDQASGAPIAGVIVKVVDSALTPLATDAMGNFTSYELDPGDVDLALSHGDYEARRCAATIPAAGGDVEMTCTLAGLPTAGSLKVALRDEFGAAVAGVRVQLTGPTTVQVTSNPTGEFLATDLAPGEYTARVESDAHLIRVVRMTIERRQQTRIDVAVSTKPAKSGVVRRGQELVAKALRFEEGAVDLAPIAAQAVAEVADYLLRDASTRRLRIECDGSDGLALTRALAIKQRIVDAGVPDGRLEAVPQASTRVKLTIVE